MKTAIFAFIIFFLVCIIPLIANGAGWQDPFAEPQTGKQNGWIDPFASQKQQKQDIKKEPQKTENIQTEKKISPKIESQNPVLPNQVEKPVSPVKPEINPNQPKTMWKPDMIQQKDKMQKPDMILQKDKQTDLKKKQGDMSANEKSSGNTSESQIDEPFLPYDVKKGMKMEDAIASLDMIPMADCGDGILMFHNAPTGCLAIRLTGKKFVTGGSFYFSKACLPIFPGYGHLKDWILKNGGKETANGWEFSSDSQPATQCINRASMLSDDNIPQFIGGIHRFMDKRLAFDLLDGVGAVKTANYSDGTMFNLDGTDIACRICPRTGELTSLSFKVNKESEIARKAIDKMKLTRETAKFPSATVRTKFVDGKAVMGEFLFEENMKKCRTAI